MENIRISFCASHRVKQSIFAELKFESNAAIIEALREGVESADGIKTDKFILYFIRSFYEGK